MSCLSDTEHCPKVPRPQHLESWLTEQRSTLLLGGMVTLEVTSSSCKEPAGIHSLCLDDDAPDDDCIETVDDDVESSTDM